MADLQYRVYLTDILKLINANIVHYVGGEIVRERYADMISKEDEPEKTGDEIALDIIKRAGLKVRKE